jgi:hypothetical protein
MTIINSRDLNLDDMKWLGASLAEEIDDYIFENHNRIGCRPPKGYLCYISVKIKSPSVREAINHVLKQISEHFYEDAIRLQETVACICPIEKNSKCCGRWEPYPIFDFDRDLINCYEQESEELGYCEEPIGCIRIRDDQQIDFHLTCVVFAHECGHAVNRGEFMEDRLESEVPIEFFQEAAANYYVQRWGFGELLERFSKKDLSTITPQGLKALHC